MKRQLSPFVFTLKTILDTLGIININYSELDNDENIMLLYYVNKLNSIGVFEFKYK